MAEIEGVHAVKGWSMGFRMGYRDNGKEIGNYNSILGVISGIGLMALRFRRCQLVAAAWV